MFTKNIEYIAFYLFIYQFLIANSALMACNRYKLSKDMYIFRCIVLIDKCTANMNHTIISFLEINSMHKAIQSSYNMHCLNNYANYATVNANYAIVNTNYATVNANYAIGNTNCAIGNANCATVNTNYAISNANLPYKYTIL